MTCDKLDAHQHFAAMKWQGAWPASDGFLLLRIFYPRQRDPLTVETAVRTRQQGPETFWTAAVGFQALQGLTSYVKAWRSTPRTQAIWRNRSRSPTSALATEVFARVRVDTLQATCRSYRVGTSSHMRRAKVGHQHPRTPALRSTTNPSTSHSSVHIEAPTTRKPRRRAERMLPMESNYVRFPSSASFWAADLHRRVCEWEVRPWFAAV